MSGRTCFDLSRLAHYHRWCGLHLQEDPCRRQGLSLPCAIPSDLTQRSRTSQISNSLFDLVGTAKSTTVKHVLPVDYVTADMNAQTGAATDKSGVPDG
jgi:hypothetical protein